MSVFKKASLYNEHAERARALAQKHAECPELSSAYTHAAEAYDKLTRLTRRIEQIRETTPLDVTEPFAGKQG